MVSQILHYNPISTLHLEQVKKREVRWIGICCVANDGVQPSEDDKMLSCTPNTKPSIKASDFIALQDVMSKLNSIENKYMLLSKFDLLVKENISLKSELNVVKKEFEILNDRIAEDMKEVAQLWAPAGIVSTDIMKVLRVGKKGNRSRPTKVVLSSADVAQNCNS
ncbi:hypothetical protein HHI36_011610 [Cryptolaemus montrouzieri]|uniref:Uncharacterized protein n=1 Tax=Cryptolaemus montrouzieri TaxID=559131 RepID=A0ABD2MM72_9CUCU